MFNKSRLITLLAILITLNAQAQPAPPLREWGEATLRDIDSTFLMPGRNLYAEEVKIGQPLSKNPAFMWGCGVQLPALVAATRLDRKTWAPELRRFSDALQSYWTLPTTGPQSKVGGYDVWPGPKPVDRYYDDNEWMVLALAEAYEVTREPVYLERAEATMRFVMTGEDDKLGGGIYWKENGRDSKNTCSNGPAAAAALRLYQLTNKPEYRAIGLRLYNWTREHLQDTDGLFFDNEKLDGKVEKTKWSYNTALMLRSACLLYASTHDRQYLDQAERMAQAAEAHWVRQDTGGIADGSQFAHLLTEAWLYLSDQDHNRHWVQVVDRALVYLHDHLRDPNGRYGKNWDTPLTEPLTTIRLIDYSSVARAYLVAARYR